MPTHKAEALLVAMSYAQLAAVASGGDPPTPARQTNGQRRAFVAGFVLVISVISYGTTSLLKQSAVSGPIQSAQRPLVTRAVNSLPGEKLHPTLSPDADRERSSGTLYGHNLYVTGPPSVGRARSPCGGCGSGSRSNESRRATCNRTAGMSACISR